MERNVNLELLKEPFSEADLEWRVGNKSKDGTKATLLVYITARAVMDRLDEVFTPGGWSTSYEKVQTGKQEGFICTLSCLTPTGWVSKQDVSDSTDIEALKGGFSGALKRAAVQWGIGRYLYRMGEEWVDLKDGYAPRDKKDVAVSVKTDNGYKWCLPPKVPDWALPEKERTASKKAAEKKAAPEKETPAEEQARRAAHDNDWETGGRIKFMGIFSNKWPGVSYDTLCGFLESIKRGRPSTLTVDQRSKMLDWLNDAGSVKFLDYIQANKKGLDTKNIRYPEDEQSDAGGQ
jgi:hypothetical protein